MSYVVRSPHLPPVTPLSLSLSRARASRRALSTSIFATDGMRCATGAGATAAPTRGLALGIAYPTGLPGADLSTARFSRSRRSFSRAASTIFLCSLSLCRAPACSRACLSASESSTGVALGPSASATWSVMPSLSSCWRSEFMTESLPAPADSPPTAALKIMVPSPMEAEGRAAISVKKLTMCLRIKGLRRIWSRSGRCAGLISSICPMSSCRCLEYFVLIGGYFPLTILVARPLMELASKAWLRVVISYNTQPRAQMSDLKE
mmetsp:Transcript_25917/g.58208  ORF Transcript_25917/g.58208 Transcript_25917/m.58208 type:complete len:263 (+) Transcript_25917:123-911(+)